MQPVKHFRRFVMPSSARATLLPEALLGIQRAAQAALLPSQIRHAFSPHSPLYELWCGSLAAFVFWGVLKVKINQTAINCGAFGNMGNSIRSSNVKGFKRCVCYLSINVSICIYVQGKPPSSSPTRTWYILSDQGQTTPDDASFWPAQI